MTRVARPVSLKWSAASAADHPFDRQEYPARQPLFAQVAAVAVLGSTLAFGRVPATAAPAEGSAKVAAAASATSVAPRALGPWDVLKAVKGLYDAYKTWTANEAVGRPCGASDSDNIRAARDKLEGRS